MATYTSPGLSVHMIDDIPALIEHPNTKVLSNAFKGKKLLCKLPGGQLFFESKLALDTDGSPVYSKQDASGQLQTAVKDANGKDLDSDIINYYVLPGGFWETQGIRKGDIGVVIFGVFQAFACFGDVGPANSLGEGSIALHRELGNETIVGRHTAGGGKLINRGIGSGVITVVFPGSGNGTGVNNQNSAIVGRPLWNALKNEATTYANSSWRKNLDGPTPSSGRYA